MNDIIGESIKQPIRVLCVFSTLDHGGAESMCMNLYRHIDRSKIQFDFVKHTPEKCAFDDEIQNLGGRIYIAPRLNICNVLSYRLWWKNHFANHPEHLIVHGHFFSISAVYFAFAKQANRITVGHIHASQSDSKLKTLLEKRISKYTNYPIACSEEAGRWIYGDRSFTVLHNALDVMMFKYNPENRRIVRNNLELSDNFTLGTTANFSNVKNPMGLIDIFLAVKKKNQKVKLLWAGDGGMRAEIENRLIEEGITEDVYLLGSRDDISSLLQAIDVFLLPSFNEGLPVSAIEAQAAGLPCFISNNVTREVDITGLCHFLPIVQPSNWAEVWAHTILADRTKREDKSDKIREAGYDIQSTSNWLSSFYLNIIESYKERKQ